MFHCSSVAVCTCGWLRVAVARTTPPLAVPGVHSGPIGFVIEMPRATRRGRHELGAGRWVVEVEGGI